MSPSPGLRIAIEDVVRTEQSMEMESMFDELRGAQLSAVTFVQDNLQLWFDGPCINVTNRITVATAEGTVTSWASGFRDALCAQIAKTVSAVERRPQESLVLAFEDGSKLSISLRPEDYSGPEAYYAHGFAHNAWLAE